MNDGGDCVRRFDAGGLVDGWGGEWEVSRIGIARGREISAIVEVFNRGRRHLMLVTNLRAYYSLDVATYLSWIHSIIVFAPLWQTILSILCVCMFFSSLTCGYF